MVKDSRITEWEEKELTKSLARFPERKENFKNHGNEEIPRISFPEDINDSYISEIGFPGRYPFRNTDIRGSRMTDPAGRN